MMKKKILNILIFLSILLVVFSASTKVEAEETVYKAVDVYGNIIPDSEKNLENKYDDAVFISPYDYLVKEYSNYDDRLDLVYHYSDFGYMDELMRDSNRTQEEVEETYYRISARTGINFSLSADQLIDYIDYIRMQSDFVKKVNFPLMYISSVEDFNKYLIRGRYINEGQTYLDVDFSKLEFGNWETILRSIENQKIAYLVDISNVPKYIYSLNNITSVVDFCEVGMYCTVDSSNIYVKDGFFTSYFDAINGEKSKIDLPNSYGKFKAISKDKFEYNYKLLYFNNDYGYFDYTYTEGEHSILLDINQVPKCAFDLFGNLKDIFISITENYWYPVSIRKQTNLKWVDCALEKVLLDAIKCYYGVLYFNFNFPIDTLEYVEFNLPMFYRYKILGITIKDYPINELSMSVYRDETIRIPPNLSFKDFYPKWTTSYCIEKGPFNFESKIYDFKIIYLDDNYSIVSGKYSDYYLGLYEDDSYDIPTYFSYDIYLNDSIASKGKFVYTYNSIVYGTEGYFEIEKPKDDPSYNDDINCKNFIEKIFNNNIIKIIFFTFIIIIFFPLFKFLFNLLKNIFLFFVKKIKKE